MDEVGRARRAAGFRLGHSGVVETPRAGGRPRKGDRIMRAVDSRKSGQAMVEYIIIVVIIAIAAIAIFGIFGDTIRSKLSGAVTELGGDSSAAQTEAGKTGDSKKWLQDLDSTGHK
jgi:Flp pilus assembly pilin Flp